MIDFYVNLHLVNYSDYVCIVNCLNVFSPLFVLLRLCSSGV